MQRWEKYDRYNPSERPVVGMCWCVEWVDDLIWCKAMVDITTLTSGATVDGGRIDIVGSDVAFYCLKQRRAEFQSMKDVTSDSLSLLFKCQT